MKVPLQDYSGLALGIEFFISIVGLTALGHWADSHWRTSPWLSVVGFVLGATGGFWSMYRFATKPPRSSNGTNPKDG